MKILKNLAILGNSLFILWIVYNGIDERGQRVRPVEAVALSSLIILLILNIFVIFKHNR